MPMNNTDTNQPTEADDLLFSGDGIPHKDLAEFEQLPARIRKEILVFIRCIRRLELAKQQGVPLRELAVHLARNYGLSVKTIYRKRRDYFLYGWQGMINRAKWPSPPAAASKIPFRHFVHGLWLANNRHYKNTHAQLIAIWKGRAPIPGYERPPEKSPWNDCPPGWTYCNIIQHIKAFEKDFPGEAAIK